MISDALSDFAQPTTLPFAVIALRIGVAALCGAAVGLEREWRHRPAGLRTHLLIAIAASVFAILGIEIVHTGQFVEDSVRFDPMRVIEAVTAGVAFLAAGTIIVARGRIEGLTTGAGMWLVGAIGLAAGLGLWQVAALATFLAVAVLALLRLAEHKKPSRDP